MQIIISPAKTINTKSSQKAPAKSIPQFAGEAKEIALHMAQYSVEELEQLLKISPKLALETFKRFEAFHSDEAPSLQALLAYTGMVFKHIAPTDFSDEDFLYAHEHLRIASPFYGLVRPLDMIKAYRMEYDVKLPELGNISMADFWKSKLTLPFIEDVKNSGGVLVNLASMDIQPSFDWKHVEKEVRVITPEFKMWKKGKLDTVTIYAKMARGEMTRFILKNRIEEPEVLKAFTWEGFAFNQGLSDESRYVFTC
nr:peroxide stress protein YaaA [uncultured Bacteroides sp.]